MQVNKILIVDDDAEDSEFFTEVLSNINPEISVCVASTRDQLFECLEAAVPDLVFMDSFIQHESGLDSMRQIKGNEKLVSIPVIMYTGSSDWNHISSAFHAGASAYIVKPDTLNGIRDVLQEVLKQDWNDPGSSRKQYFINGKGKTFEE
jgi:DNA-binding NtrC family response regulator